MNIEDLREYCLSLPYVTEDCPFEPDGIAFRVMGKIFAYLDVKNEDYFCMKCNPQYALQLREKYQAITGAWHWNKKYWNQVSYKSTLTDDFIKHLIRHSFREVVKKFPKRMIGENPKLASIDE
jgi:Uncharacterized protein conserved in bacteria